MARTMAESARKLTYEDLLLFPDDGKRHEIIDGEHHVSASPNVVHQRVLLALYRALYETAQTGGLGEVLVAPLDVVFSRHDVVEPDLLYVGSERAANLTAANVQGSPDLVVEVLSPSSRRYDEIAKRRLYEGTEVREYWLVDPEAETVKVYRREGDAFARPLLLSAIEGDRLSTPMIPALDLPLARLFGR